MKSFLLFLSLFASSILFAQESRPVGALAGQKTEDSWKLTFGKKTIFKAGQEDESANVLTMTRAMLKKKGTYTLTYNKGKAQAGWNRSIIVYGADDNTELQRIEGSSVSWKNTALAKLVHANHTLRIYTMALPSDPKKAAVIRVRRVHLLTIKG